MSAESPLLELAHRKRLGEIEALNQITAVLLQEVYLLSCLDTLCHNLHIELFSKGYGLLSFQIMEDLITNFIHFYNKDRIQKKLGWKSPMTFSLKCA